MSTEVADRGAFLALGSKPRRYGEVTLPVSGLTVRFHSLTSKESAAFDREEYDYDDMGRKQPNDEVVQNVVPRMIVRCLVDANNQRMLTDDDLEAIAPMDTADTDALFWAIRRHQRPGDFIDLKKSSPGVSNGTPASSSDADLPKLSESQT